MPIDYSITLQDITGITLKWNFWWIHEWTSTQGTLSLALFAFNQEGTPIFSTKFWYLEIVSLYNYLWLISIVRDNTIFSTAKFRETDEILRLIDNIPFDRSILVRLLEKLSTESKIQELLTSLSDEEILLLSTNHKEIQRKRVIEELKTRLNTWGYSETTWDDSWQRWISDNSWLTWANYIKPIEKQRISITWIMPDYLFPTHDWFIDILEIKLPDDDVIKEDLSHRWSWIWTSETNKAIGQVVNYIWEIDRLRREIEEKILSVYHKKFTLIRPRAYIIIGNDDIWFEDESEQEVRENKRRIKLEALRKLNWSLHGIEVITYAELIRRWNSFLNDI